MLARIMMALWLAAALPAAASAQAVVGPGGPRAAVAPAEAAPPADGPAAQLVEILRDEAARNRLIAELEQAAAGAAASPAVPAAAAEERQPFAERLVSMTRSALAETASVMVTFWNGLLATWRRLGALGTERSAQLLTAAQSLLLVLIVTLAAHQALRFPTRRIARRLARGAEGRGAAERVARYAVKVVVDLLAVGLAYVAGIIAALVTLSRAAGAGSADFGALQQAVSTNAAAAAVEANLSLYLNAFLATQLARVAIRAALAPDAPQLRVAPFTDAGARAWSRRLAVLASVLGYGLVLVAPMVASTVSVITGRAVEVLVYAIATAIAAGYVIAHRKEPAAWFERRSPPDMRDATTRIGRFVAHVWHWPVLAWLLVVFVVAVSRSGAVEPILAATGRALGVLAGGAALMALVWRLATRGVRLPPSWTEALPALEDRLNGFLQQFLGALRFLILAMTVALALTTAGIVDVVGFVDRTLGANFREALASVLVFVVVAFLIWLAVASWVDYRLKPDHPTPATPREQTLLTLFRNAVSVAIVVVTAMSSLSELGFDIAPLLASAGVLGLAIGFGAQKLVQDIITGLFIQLENAINVGDVVTVAGITGSVEKLTIRSVSLRDLEGAFHIIPFSSVDMVSNFMRGYAFHVAVMGIAYREDVENAKRLMHEAFDELKADREFSRSIIGPLEWHGVIAFGPNSVDVRARIRTRPGQQWAVGRAYNAIVKRKFDAEGVEIPFPQQTIWFGDEAPKRGARRLTGRDAEDAADAASPAQAAS